MWSSPVWGQSHFVLATWREQIVSFSSQAMPGWTFVTAHLCSVCLCVCVSSVGRHVVLLWLILIWSNKNVDVNIQAAWIIHWLHELMMVKWMVMHTELLYAKLRSWAGERSASCCVVISFNGSIVSSMLMLYSSSLSSHHSHLLMEAEAEFKLSLHSHTSLTSDC